MTVINLTITESSEQIISGIPRFVTISSNIASVIFYSLDGSTPTVNSNIYVEKIQLPININIVYLNVFATDGVNSSPILNNIYQTNTLGKGARTSHSGTDAQPNATQGLASQYPFGSSSIMPGQNFVGAAEVGFTTDNPLLPETPTGFDGNGNPTGFVNEPLIGVPTMTQPIIYATSDAQGQTGPNIGTLPKFSIQVSVPPPEQINYSDKLFDPRALVIFQDFTKPNDPNMPVEINRQFYSESNTSHQKTGGDYFNEASGPQGTFLRQHYNPSDQTMTYYYWNSSTNRWIISKTAYTPEPNSGNYSNIVFGRETGAGFVFRWHSNRGNYLY